ncbi:MAG: hypothetical protein ACHQ1D_01960 [Nitrososphaerales archaeon]
MFGSTDSVIGRFIVPLVYGVCLYPAWSHDRIHHRVVGSSTPERI